MRFDPFRELDRFTQQTFGQARPAVVPMDAYREDGQFVVSLDLPGVDPGSLEITVERDVLTVKGERPQSRGEGQQWLIAERPHGAFTRQLFLGQSLDSEHVQAHYDQGVLTLTIPVAEQAKPRKVEVTSGGGQKAINATASAAA